MVMPWRGARWGRQDEPEARSQRRHRRYAIHAHGAHCYHEDGMQVCSGAKGGYGRGGTTIGDTYITGSKTGHDCISHENRHRDLQWRRFGWNFGWEYFAGAAPIPATTSGSVRRDIAMATTTADPWAAPRRSPARIALGAMIAVLAGASGLAAFVLLLLAALPGDPCTGDCRPGDPQALRFAYAAVPTACAAMLAWLALRVLGRSRARFVAPPGWPPPPPGWRPPQHWQPPQDWPQAPEGWRFWQG